MNVIFAPLLLVDWPRYWRPAGEMTDLQQFTENGGSPSQVTLEDIDVGIEIDLQDGNGTENVKKGHADGGDSG